jgi:catalase
MRRVRSASFDDHFSQATMFWNSMSAPEKEHIAGAFSFELAKVNRVEIRRRVVEKMLANIDLDLAAAVAENVGLPAPVAPSANGKASVRPDGATKAKATGSAASSPLLSQLHPKTGVIGNITGRKVAILVAPGASGADVQTIKTTLAEAGAKGLVVGSSLAAVDGAQGPITIDHTILTMPSVTFDAVYIPSGMAAAAAQPGAGEMRNFVGEAYKHAKALAASGDSAGIFAKLGIETGEDPANGVLSGDAAEISDAFIAAIGNHRAWERAGRLSVPA